MTVKASAAGFTVVSLKVPVHPACRAVLASSSKRFRSCLSPSVLLFHERASPSLHRRPIPPAASLSSPRMHRGYLDQAIAFKREQGRENRTRGRRHTSQQDEWLERQRKEQREQAFSTYFNGANESKAADGAAQRRWERRRDSTGAIDGQDEAAEYKRRGWRRPDREITGKITEHSSSTAPPLSPHNLPASPTAAEANQQPFASPSSSPPLVFSIHPSSSSPLATSPTTSPPARRRTWSRGSAVELRAEDGEVVRLEPRVLRWDVAANRGPVTCRRRVEAELRGEVLEEEAEQHTDRSGSKLKGAETNEHAEAEAEQDELQTGEDTSAEVSYSGHALTSDDNPGLSSRSSHSPRQTSTATVADSATETQGLHSATGIVGRRRSGQSASPVASLGPTPPFSHASQPESIASRVTPLDFSSLFSSPAVSGPSSRSITATPPVSFGRRATQSDQAQVEAKDESRDELKEADEDGARQRSTAWQISMELTADEEQQMKQREDKAEKERLMAQQRRDARAGRRAKRSTAPAASTSAAIATAIPTSADAAGVQRSRARRHTANDASAFHSRRAAPTVPLVAAAAASDATTAAAAEVAAHSLDDLQRSWDDLDQFLATELASLSSTAATRKSTRLSVTHDAFIAAAPKTFAAASGEADDEEDVDAIIDDFLASTPTSLPPTQRSSPSNPAALSIVSLPVLPAGTELTLRVLSAWGGTTSRVEAAAVRRVECYDDVGSLINTVPLPTSLSSAQPSTTLSFSFARRHRVSLVRLFNSAASACGVRRVELLLDDRLLFCGELVADSCESLLFTRDEALIGRLLRTIHSTAVDRSIRSQQQQPAARLNAAVEGEKRVVHVWRDGIETLCSPRLS